MNSIGISEKDQLSLLEGIAAILHLGNIQFEVFEGGNNGSTTPGSKIVNMEGNIEIFNNNNNNNDYIIKI